MKYNPITQTLFTDSLTALKKLHCPLNKHWDELTNIAHSQDRLCATCQHQVLDTALLNERDLQRLLQLNPNTCLKVDINQFNITITYDT
ncbi:MAG: hypothetical protein JWQ34_3158 [Mucilaginibacter sp.]|nr:hypothetical protein [Mucilaginibacter sp.]